RVRLRDLPQWMFDRLATQHENSVRAQYLLATLEPGRTLDAERADGVLAMHQLEAVERKYGASDWLNCCLAYCAAVHLENLSQAEAALAEVTAPSSSPAMHHAALAAMAMRQGNCGDAKLQLMSMRAEVRKQSPYFDLTFRDIQRQIE